MNTRILLGLIVMILLISSVYALGAPFFMDNTNDDFDDGTLYLINISGSGADANVTLNFTINIGNMSGGHVIYNTIGNFTSKIFDTNTTDSRFDKIAWTSVLPNSSDVVGIAMHEGKNDIGVFYRNGRVGAILNQANLASDVDFSSTLVAYTIPSVWDYQDIVGFGWDTAGGGNGKDIYAFFKNGSVAGDLNQETFQNDLDFTGTTSSYTIPAGFNTSDIIGFAIERGSDAAVFFKNKSVVEADSNDPPFSFTNYFTYTLLPGFDTNDAIGIGYDRGANDIAIFFNNGSIVSDTDTTSLGENMDFDDGVFLATYNSGFNILAFTNITLQTRMSNDSTTFTPWSDLYINHNGSENISGNIGRYIQYKAVLSTPDKYITPYLQNVTINFTQDVIPPRINKISFSPNSTDDVDPNTLLNFTINATDGGVTEGGIADSGIGINITILQYKQSGAGLFINVTASLHADGLYYANFTPNIVDTWNYRVYVRDNSSAENNDTSDTFNISVGYERTWTRIPATFNNLACGFSKTCHTGNITINNTGDFTLNFDLNSNFGGTSYNITEPFDLTAKEVRVVEVNLIAGSTASENNVVITIDATTSNAEPDLDTTNFTFVESAGGPVFELTIVTPPTEVNKSFSGAFNLSAKLKNIGNETAGITWINWTLPDNWLNISGTNLTKNISTISVQEIVYHNITVNLTSSASTGTQKVNVTAASNNSASDSATAFIVVTTTSTVIVVTIDTGGGGGGGSSSGGGGGGSLVRVSEEAEEIEISQTVDLVRGGENTFTIEVTNTFEDSVLEDLTLQVEGFLSQYVTIEPKIITNLGYQQSRTFTVTVAAPAYKGFEEHTLKATVTGMLVKTENIDNITVTSKNPFILKNYISLIIHETSKEEVDASLKEAAKLIEDMQQAGFPVRSPLKLLEKAKEKLDNRRYQLAKDISDQIKDINTNAFLANSLMSEIKSKIYDYENKGLRVEETRRLLNLALAAFEREDFLSAIQRVKDAELSIVIETKGKINVVKFVIDYWWPLLVLLIVVSISSYFVRKKLTLIIIARRLQDLQKEEVTINELMQEIQKKYYKDKKIGTIEYHKAMYGYEKRLSEVSQSISRLRSQRVGIIEISNEIKNLKKEDQNVTDLIKQLQDGYFNKQTITRKIYLKRVQQYKVRRVEIEKSTAVLEAKLAKKEKLAELKVKEASEKDISSGIKKKEVKFRKQQPPIEPKTKSKNKFSFNNLFRKEKKKGHSGEVNGLLDDLIKRKDGFKEKFLPNARIKTIQKKILGAEKEKQPKEIISNEPLIWETTKKPIEKTIKIPSMLESIKKSIEAINPQKIPENKKEIIPRLKEKFHLDSIKPKTPKKYYEGKGYKKHFSKDIEALKEHGFKIKVPGEKKPEPTYVIPKAETHTKHSIINHLNEVYKHG